MSALDDVFKRDFRLVFLRILRKAPQGSANSSLMHKALISLGHPCGDDYVMTQAAWLQEQNLIEISEVSENISVYHITKRGRDVAQGLVSVPGVDTPGER